MIYKIENECELYMISKLLFYLKYEHKVYINNDSNIYIFDDTNMLIYTNVALNYHNITNYIITSSQHYNSTNIYEKINEIAANNNIYLNIKTMNDIHKVIYDLFEMPTPDNINIIKTNNQNSFNLPILVYKISSQQSRFYNICRIFTYKFNKIGLHTLSIILTFIYNNIKNNTFNNSKNKLLFLNIRIL